MDQAKTEGALIAGSKICRKPPAGVLDHKPDKSFFRTKRNMRATVREKESLLAEVRELLKHPASVVLDRMLPNHAHLSGRAAELMLDDLDPVSILAFDQKKERTVDPKLIAQHLHGINLDSSPHPSPCVAHR